MEVDLKAVILSVLLHNELGQENTVEPAMNRRK